MYRMIGADGREYGPISADQLRQWIGQGRANATTSVLPEGASEWKPLGSLPEFSMLFAGPAPSPTPTPTPASTPVTPQVFPSYPAEPRTHGFATAGLVLGILSLTVGLCCCYGLPFSLLGLIFRSSPSRKSMPILSVTRAKPWPSSQLPCAASAS